MLAVRPPFAYRAGRGVLHRAPAGLKLLCVVIVSALCFASVYGLAAAVALVLAASVAARIPPWQLLKGSKPLVILSLFIVPVKTFLPITPEMYRLGGLVEGLIIVLRIFVPYAAAALFFAVTTMHQLRQSIRAFDRTSGFGANVSLGLCLMLGFIPRFFDLWETSSLACDARSCTRGLRRLFLLIPLVTERMMEAAADTALALQARGCC